MDGSNQNDQNPGRDLNKYEQYLSSGNEPPKRRSRLVIVIIVGAVILIGLLGGLFFYS